MKHFEQLDRDDRNRRGRSQHKEVVRRNFRRYSKLLVRNFAFDFLPVRNKWRGFTL